MEIAAHDGGQIRLSNADGRTAEQLIWDLFEQHPMPERQGSDCGCHLAIGKLRLRRHAHEAMKRTGVLAGLLVVMLGTGAMAQSPSPDATVQYAPDDIVPALEAAGDSLPAVDWSIDGGGGVVMEELLGLDAVLEFLDTVDKEPNDIRFGIGRTIDQPLDDVLNLYVVAVRVAGTPADVLVVLGRLPQS